MAKRLTPKQFRLACRAHYGLIPRPPVSELPHITARDYKYVIVWWQVFDVFRGWRDRGGPKPRYAWSKAVPPYAWTLLQEIRAKWPIVHVKPAPPPEPERPIKLSMGQCWLVIAQAYENAVHAPNYFKRAFVADRAYTRPSVYEVRAYHDRGIMTAAWGDSRPPGMEGTSPQQIVDMANELKTTTCMFQAELNVEYRAATAMIDKLGGNGWPLIMNRSQIASDPAQYKDLQDRIRRGNVLGISECYKNCGWGDPDWGDLAMASTLGATYRDGDCPGQTQGYYYTHSILAPSRDSWYTAQWEPFDYASAR